MELINYTSYPSMTFRAILDDDNLATSVIVRVTYDIQNDKSVPSSNQSWALYTASWESEYGPVEGDSILRLGGVDLLVFGMARALNKTPITKMQVKVKCDNGFSHSMAVFGNRMWEKNLFGMRISDPEPFTELPMTVFNAFGGCANWDGLKLPYGNNPFGKGYYWEREEAINSPLPNIEDPNDLVCKWDDRPDPVGIASCPMNELRMRGNVKYDSSGQITNIHARFFNTAFPKMIVSQVLPGENITLEGMTTSGIFNFKIPDHRLKAIITLGEKVSERQLKIDQIGIVPDKNQAFITYRFPFRYRFEPLQIRKCEIIEIV